MNIERDCERFGGSRGHGIWCYGKDFVKGGCPLNCIDYQEQREAEGLKEG